ncbi:MAG: isoprenylcysteine carboxylmethyltransferase family protein [Colwellia sp.]
MDLKIIPIVQFIVSAILMIAVSHYLPSLNFTFSLDVILAAVLIGIASIIGIVALYNFHQHKTTYHPHTPEKTTKVVNSGIYAYSRNPMYLALVLVLLALAIYLQNISAFTFIPLFIWYITQYQIKPEENTLNTLFADDYQTYCAKVRRWI